MFSLPTQMIFFVTSHCNLRCAHCFNWKNLDRQNDLSLQKIEKFARSLPELQVLLLSGGEPFLRDDFVDICQAFFTNGQLQHINIPTNGTMPERIACTVERILRLPGCPQTAIGVSLDGAEMFHDRNRGVAGSFNKAMECCRKLLELKEQYSRLEVNVLTTVTETNTEELLTLQTSLAKEFPTLDHFYWSALRGDLKKQGPPVPSFEQMEHLDNCFLNAQASKKTPKRLRLEKQLYALRRDVLKNKRQPVPCVAGSTIGVLFDNGIVAPCELLPGVGNIREQAFSEIWSSDGMRQARHSIERGECACTHECFLYPSYIENLQQKPFALWRVHGIRAAVFASRKILRQHGWAGRQLDSLFGSPLQKFLDVVIPELRSMKHSFDD